MMKKTIFALVFAGALFVQPILPVVSVFAEENKEEVKEEMIDAAKSVGFGEDIKKKRTELLNLDKDMQLLRKDISTLNEGLKKEADLLRQEAELKEKERFMEERWNQFAERLQIWQTEGTPHDQFLNYLLGSESLADMLSKAYTYSLLLQADEDMIESMQQETIQLAAEKDALEKELKELRKKKAESLKKEKQLSIKQKKMKQELGQLEEKEVERIKEALRLQAELKQELLEKQLSQEKRKQELLANKLTQEEMDELIQLTAEMNIELTFESTFIHPTEGRITSNTGVRKDPKGSGEMKAHNGIDIANSVGTTILATADGVVVKALESNTGYGHYITLQHDIEGVTYYSVYAHLSVIGVTVGEKVKQGEIIALMGNTGRSTGPHLHFELQDKNKQYFDPLPFLDQKDKVKEKPLEKKVAKKVDTKPKDKDVKKEVKKEVKKKA